MMAIVEAVICIALMTVNRVAVMSKYEERAAISMICMALAIVVADLM